MVLQSAPPKGVKELLEEDAISEIPELYLLSLDARPCLSQVCHTQQPPVIDLAGLVGDRRSQTVDAINRACQDWGILQVINHGVPFSSIEAIWTASREFFGLPARERMRWYTGGRLDPVAYQPTFGKDWDDSLVFRPFRDEDYNFSQAPECCREPVAELVNPIRKLGTKICDALAESLGVKAERLEKHGACNLTYVKLHHYSPCPDPSLVLGKVDHTDPNFLTYLIQDQVEGLQVLKDDRWVAVDPLPDAVVINVGDQLEMLTNGRYKSVQHRVVANMEGPRSSVACFMGPRPQDRVGPMEELITQEKPKLYREMEYAEYQKIFNKNPSRKVALGEIQIARARKSSGEDNESTRNKMTEIC